MRIDVVSIFPEYLAALDVSLIGKARADGLLDIAVHDLRDFTHDRHRTVDDTPFGGGAGMVMKPQPWAEALDAVLAAPGPDSPAAGTRPHLVVPGPGGTPFTQAMARDLATEPWLAFACGRYEGIDERVYEHAAQTLGLEVTVVSLGDYVLNGGEVAVLAMVEAVGRLVPGVIGNAESLVEESHEDGLLEYPIYTKPRVWNDREVPEVLLGGNHAAIAAWRHEQRLARTAARRPDLLAADQVTTDGGLTVDVTAAVPGDVPELFTLARAVLGSGAGTIDDLADEVRAGTVWVARSGRRLVGAVPTGSGADTAVDAAPAWSVGPVLVVPDLVDRGLERRLVEHAEQTAPSGIREIRLTLVGGAAEARPFRKAGYRPAAAADLPDGQVRLTKRVRGPGTR